MKIHFSFKNVDLKAKEVLQKYADEKKISRLTRLLQHGNLEVADLDIKTEYFTKHNAFDVKMSLKIKKDRLLGGETSHDIRKAFDFALNRVIAQLRKIENIKHKK